MKILDVTQGSPEWLQARLGIPTASGYDKILTPKKMTASTQAVTYRNQLAAEWLLGHPIDWQDSNGFMTRGTGMEAEARAFYELQHDVDVEQVGFILRDDGRTGGSPDALVGGDGILEIKCPAIHTHIGYVIDHGLLTAKYHAQVNGYLYLSGREWVDIISYNPMLPSVQVRIERDEKYIAALGPAIDTFCDYLDAVKEQLAAHKQELVTV